MQKSSSASQCSSGPDPAGSLESVHLGNLKAIALKSPHEDKPLTIAAQVDGHIAAHHPRSSHSGVRTIDDNALAHQNGRPAEHKKTTSASRSAGSPIRPAGIMFATARRAPDSQS